MPAPATKLLFIGNSFTRSLHYDYNLVSEVVRLATSLGFTLDAQAQVGGGFRLCDHAVCQDIGCMRNDMADWRGYNSNLGGSLSEDRVVSGNYDAVIIQGMSTEFLWPAYNNAFCQYEGKAGSTNSCASAGVQDCGLCYGSSDQCALRLCEMARDGAAQLLVAQTWAYPAYGWDIKTMTSGIVNGTKNLKDQLEASNHSVRMIPYGAAALACYEKYETTWRKLFQTDDKHFGSLGATFNAMIFLATFFNLTVSQVYGMATDQETEELAECVANATSANLFGSTTLSFSTSQGASSTDSAFVSSMAHTSSTTHTSTLDSSGSTSPLVGTTTDTPSQLSTRSSLIVATTSATNVAQNHSNIISHSETSWFSSSNTFVATTFMETTTRSITDTSPIGFYVEWSKRLTTTASIAVAVEPSDAPTYPSVLVNIITIVYLGLF